ncbi:hypothetical protein EZS27_008137 [termite gut metagenome]|uniref:Glycoside hydrolase family 42 N-terminal domain-containing protein n=1 Tax=termite gut metagenome TaxID=433724 RepID=A0A5J4SDU9_9ZZZZ
MKSILNIVAISILIFASRKNQDEIYGQYTVPPSKTEVHAGYKQTKISWPRGSDQSVTSIPAGIITENPEYTSEIPGPSDKTPTEEELQEELKDIDEQIPVLGWWGLSYDLRAGYKDMADAGFTIDFPVDSIYPSDPDKLFDMLDVAQDNGIKLQIFASVIDNFSTPNMNKLKAHPALWGYHILDEPSTAQFDEQGARVRAVQAIDNIHPCYVNLFGTYANSTQLGAATYTDYVRDFIDKVPVTILSYDHYPIRTSDSTKSVRSDFYENLEIIAEKSRDAGIPFWAFALSTAHGPYPTPTLNDLRLQVYSNLAYGAQCIQYFTYRQPDSIFSNAPVDYSGTKTATYNTVKEMNQEIKALSKVFLGSSVVWTAHSGISGIPSGCKQLDNSKLPPQIKTFAITAGTGALVSLMKRGTDNFLIIVNHDVNENTTVFVEGDSSLRRVEKDGKIVIANKARLNTLTPGNALIYFWKN